jgi:hypothetical protein
MTRCRRSQAEAIGAWVLGNRVSALLAPIHALVSLNLIRLARKSRTKDDDEGRKDENDGFTERQGPPRGKAAGNMS